MTDQPTRVGDARHDEPAHRPDDVAFDATVTAEHAVIEPPTGRSFWRLRSTLVAGAVVGGVLLVYLLAYLVAGRTLAGGATVLGVDVGGLSPAQAETKLAAELPALVEQPIAVRVADAETTFSLVPSHSGLSIDVEATVDAVPGASATPLSLVQALFGAGEVDPVASVDRDALEVALTAVAEQADTAPVNGSVGFDGGEVVTSAAAAGRAVDLDGAADAVEATFFGSGGPQQLPLPEVELPTTEVEPAITDAEVERAVAEFATPAMSGPVEVVAGGNAATLDPAMLAAALSMTAGDGGTLEPSLDGAALAEAAAEELAEIGQEGQDATIRIEGGSPVVVPGQAGRGVAPDELAAAVLPALTAAADARTASVELTEVEPALTTEDAQALGVEEVIAEWTTRFPHAAYRNTNIGLAAQRIDDTLLLPGETFSLNDLVGERTGANGFAEGWTIDGGRLTKDFGGGVSQVATTTYHAAFLAGLEDVYHQPHSIYFDRYPVGQEATVSWGNFDMSFGNDTPYGVLVDARFSPSGPGSTGALTIKIWSTKHFEVDTSVSSRRNFTEPETIYDTSDECTPERGWEGFSITSYRTARTSEGELAKDESYPWTYRPNPTVICGPDPETEPAD